MRWRRGHSICGSDSISKGNDLTTKGHWTVIRIKKKLLYRQTHRRASNDNLMFPYPLWTPGVLDPIGSHFQYFTLNCSVFSFPFGPFRLASSRAGGRRCCSESNESRDREVKGQGQYIASKWWKQLRPRAGKKSKPREQPLAERTS